MIQGDTVGLRPFNLRISPGNLVPITGEHRDRASTTPCFVRLRLSKRAYIHGRAIRVLGDMRSYQCVSTRGLALAQLSIKDVDVRGVVERASMP